MIQDLKSKLTTCLSLERFEEKDVVYFLVEAGKLIELEGKHQTYKTLWFYRNWIVHSKITREKPYVKWLQDIFKGIHLAETKVSHDIFGFVSFDSLEKDIVRFSNEYIENGLSQSWKVFKSFRPALSAVLADIPIHLDYGNERVILSYDINGDLRVQGPGNHNGVISIARV